MSHIQMFHTANLSSFSQTFQKTNESTVYKKLFFLLSVFILIFKCLLAFMLELGNDEAYYWVYSQYWQWNYFDHPPMVAVWIRLFTVNLSLEQYEGFIRLGSIIGSILASWFLFRATALLHSERAGWYAALMYHVSFYAGISAGLYILPDSPQMVFWTLSMWMIARLTKNETSWKNWIFLGISAGICIMCKVHGAFLWSGLALYILFFRRSWLARPQLYVALILTMMICSPIVLWNIKNGFVTWRFHSNRVDIKSFAINGRSFLMQFGSQLGFNNPLNVFLVLFAFWRWKKKKMPSALTIYNLIGLPLLLSLLFVSLFRTTTLPHWSGPAYISLIPLAAISLSERNHSLFPVLLRWAAAVFVVCYLAWTFDVLFYPGTSGEKTSQRLGRGDMSLDMYGWKKAGEEFRALYAEDAAKGLMPPSAPLVTAHWWGAHVEYYFARPLKAPFLGLGNAYDLHQYLWINKQRQDRMGKDAYCIVPSDEPARIPTDFFKQTELAKVIEIKRLDRPAHYFFVYRLKNRIKEIPWR